MTIQQTKEHKTHLHANQCETTSRGICQSPTNDLEDDMRKLTQIRVYMSGETETFLHTNGGSTPYSAYDTLDFKSAMKPETATGDTARTVVTSSAMAFCSVINAIYSTCPNTKCWVFTPRVGVWIYSHKPASQNMGSANYSMICDRNAPSWLFNIILKWLKTDKIATNIYFIYILNTNTST